MNKRLCIFFIVSSSLINGMTPLAQNESITVYTITRNEYNTPILYHGNIQNLTLGTNFTCRPHTLQKIDNNLGTENYYLKIAQLFSSTFNNNRPIQIAVEISPEEESSIRKKRKSLKRETLPLVSFLHKNHTDTENTPEPFWYQAMTCGSENPSLAFIIIDKKPTSSRKNTFITVIATLVLFAAGYYYYHNNSHIFLRLNN